MSGPFRYSSPLVIPDTSQVKDKGTNEELTYVLNALRTLATHLDAVTGALSPLPTDWSSIHPLQSILGNNINKFYALCGANINYGAMVNFYALSATRVQARPAKASGFATAAAGFCNTPGGFTAGSIGEFIVGPGVNTGIGGLTPGQWYFLDPVSVTGQVTATAPSTPGQIYQLCGQAIRNDALLVGALNNWLIL